MEENWGRRPILAVYAPIFFGFKIEDTGSDIWLLPLADFPFTIEIPDWLGQKLEDIGSFDAESVVDVVEGCDIRFAAFEGAGNTEKANDIGRVGVKKLADGALAL